MSLAQWIVLAVAVQRLAELVYAQRNARLLLAAGGVEHGARHYPLIVAVHAGWLIALFIVATAGPKVDWTLLAVYALVQVGRLWVMASLGRFWTTRVIVVPGANLVTRGPYRILRHPNYLVVAAEIAVLPLAFGAWHVAVAFSLLNAAVLAWRIRVEEIALAANRVSQTPAHASSR